MSDSGNALRGVHSRRQVRSGGEDDSESKEGSRDEGADHRHASAHQTLEAERATPRERDAEVRASHEASVAEAAAAETQLTDLGRLADTQSEQLKDLQQQRDVATATLETLRRTLDTTRHAAAERLSTALKEREAADAQYRATEAR